MNIMGENTVFQTHGLNSKSYNFGHVNTSLERVHLFITHQIMGVLELDRFQ